MVDAALAGLAVLVTAAMFASSRHFIRIPVRRFESEAPGGQSAPQ